MSRTVITMLVVVTVLIAAAGTAAFANRISVGPNKWVQTTNKSALVKGGTTVVSKKKLPPLSTTTTTFQWVRIGPTPQQAGTAPTSGLHSSNLIDSSWSHMVDVDATCTFPGADSVTINGLDTYGGDMYRENTDTKPYTEMKSFIFYQSTAGGPGTLTPNKSDLGQTQPWDIDPNLTIPKGGALIVQSSIAHIDLHGTAEPSAGVETVTPQCAQNAPFAP